MRSNAALHSFFLVQSFFCKPSYLELYIFSLRIVGAAQNLGFNSYVNLTISWKCGLVYSGGGGGIIGSDILSHLETAVAGNLC